jgi:formylglycine-generating enzyme required for sulfatase activity
MNAVTNALGMEFVRMLPGSFLMGCPAVEPDRYEDETQHHVTLTRDYYLQTTPVTQQQWQAVMGTTVAQQRDLADPEESLYGEGPQYPMYFVSWADCQQFIQRLNARGDGLYRLPTEAEWEYACRAGTTTRWSCGDDPQQLEQVAWYFDNANWQTHPVKRKNPNPYGLYDMHGNVWEWCQDWYGDYPTAPTVDPQGPESGSDRALRGGSWDSPARACRAARRAYRRPEYRLNCIGLRLLRLP